MECRMKLARNLGRFELQKLGLMAIVGCFLLLSPTILAMTKPCMDSFSNWIKNMTPEDDPACHEQEMSSCRRGTNASQEEDLAGTKQRDARRNDSKLESRSICDVSGPRSIVCEMDGDVRIHGNSSSVIWITSSKTYQRNETWQIKPYARKGDSIALGNVRELSLRSMSTRDEAPHCTLKHGVPAIIFSTGGYAGNMFHDFSDMLIPLFLTSYQFHGEVRFLITNMKPWWKKKYQQMLRHLSHYEVIDFDNGDEVHCFPHAIVGLRCHREFNIDPSSPPAGYSMANLTQFMRSSYSLEREMISTKVREHSERKPRLLIISRKRTRSLTNTNEIVEMAKELGYEVVVMEPSLKMDMAQFARIVNSCDVMMGVHGAGLANMVFLPTNAVLIQIVPWGQLGGLARYDFGWAASNAGLKYLQYEIGLEESSLVEQYPRDHPIIKDPLSVHKQGWVAVRDTFLYKQNIRLDVRRFRDVLLGALRHLHQ